MTTFKSSLHKRQTTKTKEGHLAALVHGKWEDNGLWWEDGRASKISDDIVELYDYKNHQGTAQFKWAACFRNEAASFERERANQVWGGVMLVILALGGGEGLEQEAHHQFKASLAYLVSGQP